MARAFELANVVLKVVVNAPNLIEQATLANYTGPRFGDPGLTDEDERMIHCQNARRGREFEARQVAENYSFKF